MAQAFHGSQPLTTQGTVLLARAYVALGNADAARSVLSPFWRTAKLDAKDETAIIAEFGQIIPAGDHRSRMERMFYADRVNSALRVAELAQARPLADALRRQQTNARRRRSCWPPSRPRSARPVIS